LLGLTARPIATTAAAALPLALFELAYQFDVTTFSSHHLLVASVACASRLLHSINTPSIAASKTQYATVCTVVNSDGCLTKTVFEGLKNDLMSCQWWMDPLARKLLVQNVCETIEQSSTEVKGSGVRG
jgi:hypothetical protein